MARRGRSGFSNDDVAYAIGGTALVASIVGNLALHSKSQELTRNIEALRRVLADWQQSYATLDAQLTIALANNQELNELVISLREELRLVQARAYDAEQRALEAEAKREQSNEPEDPEVEPA